MAPCIFHRKSNMSSVDVCISCPTCDRVFNLEERAPRMLPGCSHSVCLECAQTAEDSCPVDVCETTGQFLVDHVTTEAVATRQAAQGPGLCSECEAVDAEVVCLGCTDKPMFCQPCWTQGHSGTKNLRAHRTVTPEEHVRDVFPSPMMCAEHPRRELNHVCQDHHVLLCDDCLPTSPHKGHKIVHVSECAQSLLADDKARAHLAQLKKELTWVTSAATSLHDRRVDCTSEIDSLFDQIVINVEKQRNQLHDEVAARVTQRVTQLHSTEQALLSRFKPLEKLYQQLRLLKKQGQHAGVIATSAHLDSLVDSLAADPVQLGALAGGDLQLKSHPSARDAAAATFASLEDIGIRQERCTFEDCDLSSVAVGFKTQFQIAARNGNGDLVSGAADEFKAVVIGEGVKIKCKFVKNDYEPGVYGSYFLLPKSGKYKLQVTRFGLHIKGSPRKFSSSDIIKFDKPSTIIRNPSALAGMLPANRRCLKMLHSDSMGPVVDNDIFTMSREGSPVGPPATLAPSDFWRKVAGLGQILVVVREISGNVIGGFVEDTFIPELGGWIQGHASNFVFRQYARQPSKAVKLLKAAGDPFGVSMDPTTSLVMGKGPDLQVQSGNLKVNKVTYDQTAPGFEDVTGGTDWGSSVPWTPKMIEAFHCMEVENRAPPKTVLTAAQIQLLAAVARDARSTSSGEESE